MTIHRARRGIREYIHYVGLRSLAGKIVKLRHLQGHYLGQSRATDADAAARDPRKLRVRAEDARCVLFHRRRRTVNVKKSQCAGIFNLTDRFYI